mmetsp:Transcript_106220/g.297359  ORF Transcript_106220/g.297359 Transcript_106220/m.297359 type:complete len:218 (-) Transcript_106220:202-855(-)
MNEPPTSFSMPASKRDANSLSESVSHVRTKAMENFKSTTADALCNRRAAPLLGPEVAARAATSTDISRASTPSTEPAASASTLGSPEMYPMKPLAASPSWNVQDKVNVTARPPAPVVEEGIVVDTGEVAVVLAPLVVASVLAVVLALVLLPVAVLVVVLVDVVVDLVLLSEVLLSPSLSRMRSPPPQTQHIVDAVKVGESCWFVHADAFANSCEHSI